MDSALLIFIKNAQKGKVKTRLAKTVGDEKALQIYKALLAHTRNVAQKVNASRFLFYSNFIDNQDDWSGTKFVKKVQEGNDLGERMSNAFKMIFESHEKIIIIGSDCASLEPSILESALQQLEKYPFVIGPAEDGGYYLLGMRNYAPSIFQNIEWSTGAVFSKTVKKIEQLGATYFLLPMLSDIDQEEDWEKYGWEI